MSALLRSLAFLLISVLVIGLAVAALLFALRQLNLFPPERVTIAAGAPGSAYHDTAVAYQRVLARDGIALDILQTAGSVENAALVTGEGGADIALVQGGVPLGDDVEGLAALQLEPIWIFARPDVSADPDPNRWQGLRVAAGSPGSGVRLVADQLAAITGAEALRREQGVAMGGAAAADGLLAGDIDIALFVAPANAPYLRVLFDSREVQYLSLANSEAIALKLPTAREVHLPAGILDYQRPLPATDLELIALISRLVARSDLHPALVNRLIHAVTEVHGGGEAVIPANREYPSARDMGIAGNAYATQLLEEGFSSLENLLPYWLVAQFNRVLLVLLPLVRLLHAVFRWIFRDRVYRHYTRVREIDQAVARAGDSLSPGRRAELRAELDRIEQRLRQANMPNSYRKQAYTLMHHLDYVRNRIDGLQGRNSGES